MLGIKASPDSFKHSGDRKYIIFRILQANALEIRDQIQLRHAVLVDNVQILDVVDEPPLILYSTVNDNGQIQPTGYNVQIQNELVEPQMSMTTFGEQII